MLRRRSVLLVLESIVVLLSVATASRGDDAPPARPGWTLAWHDEFAGDAIDPEKWGFDVGNGYYSYDAAQWIGGWGNDELQYYTRDPDNAFVRDGRLHVRALKESRDGFGYTSARLRTRRKDGTNLFSQTYGRFEMRAKLPTGRGIWPAFWLLPEGSDYGTWAASGEIDILEAKGQEPTRIQGALHFGGRWPANTHTVGEHFLEGSTIEEFHVYAVEWNPGVIHWEVDGKRYATIDAWWSTSRTDAKGGRRPDGEADLNPWPAPFDRPFQILLNVAVGGRFLGNPDATTPFPAVMEVDWVRVWRRDGEQPSLSPRRPGSLPFDASPSR